MIHPLHTTCGAHSIKWPLWLSSSTKQTRSCTWASDPQCGRGVSATWEEAVPRTRIWWPPQRVARGRGTRQAMQPAIHEKAPRVKRGENEQQGQKVRRWTNTGLERLLKMGRYHGALSLSLFWSPFKCHLINRISPEPLKWNESPSPSRLTASYLPRYCHLPSSVSIAAVSVLPPDPTPPPRARLSDRGGRTILTEKMPADWMREGLYQGLGTSKRPLLGVQCGKGNTLVPPSPGHRETVPRITWGQTCLSKGDLWLYAKGSSIGMFIVIIFPDLFLYFLLFFPLSHLDWKTTGEGVNKSGPHPQIFEWHWLAVRRLEVLQDWKIRL